MKTRNELVLLVVVLAIMTFIDRYLSGGVWQLSDYFQRAGFVCFGLALGTYTLHSNDVICVHSCLALVTATAIAVWATPIAQSRTSMELLVWMAVYISIGFRTFVLIRRQIPGVFVSF